MDTRFVLLTAAKNEEQYIARTIESVAHQTRRPEAWYIVDDGSTDHTATIIREYAASLPFIHLIGVSKGAARSFGAQYRALNLAYARARALRFDFVAVHDADIAPASDHYYEQVLDTFAREPRLGIAGGYICERQGERWVPRHANSPDAVAGGIQMFRRACFDEIGGYSPLLFGGEDWLAQIDAKRAGWTVHALPQLAVHHYRPTASADGRWHGLFRQGMMDASFGSHPVFELFKCARRVPERPALIGSLVRLGGYLWWIVSRRATLLPAEKCAYLRGEQLAKLYAMLGRGTDRHCG
jgi:glycosyltransferase involved in cell wall biosynthesis